MKALKNNIDYTNTHTITVYILWKIYNVHAELSHNKFKNNRSASVYIHCTNWNLSEQLVIQLWRRISFEYLHLKMLFKTNKQTNKQESLNVLKQTNLWQSINYLNRAATWQSAQLQTMAAEQWWVGLTLSVHWEAQPGGVACCDPHSALLKTLLRFLSPLYHN